MQLHHRFNPATNPHGDDTPWGGPAIASSRIELQAAERAAALPPDTAAVPFEAWVNGWMDDPASERGTVEVRTVTGRVVSGELVSTRPGYQHSFGTPPPPLQRAGRQAFDLVADRRDT